MTAHLQQAILGEIAHILAEHGDAAATGLEREQQQAKQAGLARAGRTGEEMERARLDRKAQVPQDFGTIAVAQPDIGKLDQEQKLPNWSADQGESGVGSIITAKVSTCARAPPCEDESGANVVDFQDRPMV